MATRTPAKNKKGDKSSKRKPQPMTLASLVAANRKLRREIAEHKRADEQLRKLSRAIEQSQITVVITDLAGNIEYVNPKFVDITGYSAEEALGNNPRIMKSGETSPEEYKRLWESIKSGRTWHGTFHNKKKNGELYWEEAIISPIFDANGKVTHFVAVKEDITERKLAEDTVQKQNHVLQALRKVAIDIGAQLEMPLLLQRAMEQAVELLQADRGGGIFLYDADQDVLRLVEGSGINTGRNGLTLAIGQGLAGKVFQTAQPLIADNCSTLARHLMEFESDPTATAFGVPLILEGRAIGVLNLFADTRLRKFNQADIDLAEMFAAQLVVAIRNAQLYQQAEREINERQRAEAALQLQNRMLSVLYENMLDVLQFQKLDDLLQLIVVRAAEVLDAPYGEIMLLDHGELVDRAFTPNQTFLAGERVKPEEARLSWQAIQTRQPVILDDYATWPHRHPIYDQVPTHAVAVFPILKGDLCLGVFEFGRDQPNYFFSPEQVQRGHLFARLAALAINNDQVYAQMRIELEARKRAEENAQRQARELSLLHIVRTALAREVDLADLLRTVVEAIAETLGYTHVSVYLQHGTVLRMQHQVGYKQPILEFPMTQGIMARCVRNATTIFLPDVRTDPEFIGAMDGLASEICVPLFEQHNAVGALNVESTIGHPLTQADVNLLNSVGDQVNIAIGRARLYSELRESERRYKDLVDNAQEIIYKTDLNGHFTFVNAAVTHLIGFSESELIGLHYLELILPDYRRAAARFYQRQLRSKTPSSYYEFPVRAKNGSIVWFGQNAQLILDPASGQVSGVQAVTRDITELHQTEAALRQHALELDTFAHTVAHDIKNPISAIIGFTDLLITDRESLPEDQIELSLHKINHSAWKMNRIVDEIMLLTGLRKETVLLQPLDMSQIINEARERLTFAIREAQAEISMPDLSNWPIAIGYAPWIEEVWVNYISNAIKYGGQPPRIELGAAHQANHSVRYWVRDNGNGLNVEEQSRLFTPLTRLNQVRVKGHGLGLSIVKRIVEKLGGTVGVDSELGRGSTFYFTLPLDTSSFTSQ